jgi:hypothetical protein
MNDQIKLIGSIGLIVLLGVMSWYFEANGIVGTFVSSVQTLFISAATALLGGLGTIVAHKGYRALKRGK